MGVVKCMAVQWHSGLGIALRRVSMPNFMSVVTCMAVHWSCGLATTSERVPVPSRL